MLDKVLFKLGAYTIDKIFGGEENILRTKDIIVNDLLNTFPDDINISTRGIKNDIRRYTNTSYYNNTSINGYDFNRNIRIVALFVRDEDFYKNLKMYKR